MALLIFVMKNISELIVVDSEFSAGNGNHINCIESFWGYTKHRLAKFNGIPKDKFDLYLKETEFRFNHIGRNLLEILLLSSQDPNLN